MVKKTFYRQKNWHSIPLKFCFCPPDLIHAFTLLSARLTPEERICLFSFTVFAVYWVSVEVAALSNLSGFVCLPCFSWRTKTGSRKRLKMRPRAAAAFRCQHPISRSGCFILTLCFSYSHLRLKKYKCDKRKKGKKKHQIYILGRLTQHNISKCITAAETKLSAVTNLIFDVL